MEIREIVSAVLLCLGAFLMFASAVGIVRFPDLFCRSHALSKGMTVGLSLMLLGFWVLPHVEGGVGLKIFAAIFFQFITIPVASHLLSNLAYQREKDRGAPPPVAGPFETRKPRSKKP